MLGREGVYLTIDEFKGRRPVRRRGVDIEVGPERLVNPTARPALPVSSGGSRGLRSAGPYDLTFVRDRVANLCVSLAARGGLGWWPAVWEVPGGAAILHLLDFAAVGAPPRRWFSQVDPAARGLSLRYRWSGRALHWGSRVTGVPLPRPEHVPLDDPAPIARWLDEVRRAGATPHLYTFPSAALRLCQTATGLGADLAGVQFLVAGEPITPTRLAAIRATGAAAAPRYAIAECGILGEGCLAPPSPDAVHLQHDLVAVIQPPAVTVGGHDGLPPRGLLHTSLHLRAPFVLLNVSLGDQADLADARCGCPLARLGWTTLLHSVRSFEKLTAGGLTFLDGDVVHVLEEVLPARFGGGPSDYQLVEQEAPGGRPELCLLVHPRVGPIAAEALRAAFLDAIGTGSGAERIMALAWRQDGIVRVERRPPRATPSGKILHLAIDRRIP